MDLGQSKMKIGIAGYGYVGQAHELMFKDRHEILINDPAKGHYADLKHADAIIICVSTPGSDNGHCDVHNIGDVIDAGPDVPYLIKSTMSCEGWRLITDCCKNKNLTYSPEFLRANYWKSDALQCKQFYLGGGDTHVWSDLLIMSLGSINIELVDPLELIAAKQLRNSFLALKVTYFNQVYDFCKAQNINFEEYLNPSDQSIDAQKLILFLISEAKKSSSQYSEETSKALSAWEGYARTDKKYISEIQNYVNRNDEGYPTPDDIKIRVFDRFFRKLGNKESGTGLGLSIVKQVLRLHDAKIQVLSPESGKGTKMQVTFKTLSAI